MIYSLEYSLKILSCSQCQINNKCNLTLLFQIALMKSCPNQRFSVKVSEAKFSNISLSGVNCEVNIDECENNTCQNNATCVDGINNFTCSCQPGFSGRFCEINIDECEVNLFYLVVTEIAFHSSINNIDKSQVSQNSWHATLKIY